MRLRTPKIMLDYSRKQRRANAKAKAEGKPLPYPSIWDILDPTKLPEDATPEQVLERYREFTKTICRRQPRKRIIL